MTDDGPSASPPVAPTGPRVWGVVVAAGSSRRMAGIDKIRAEVAGRPLLAWSVEALAAAPGIAGIVIVASAEGVAEIRAAAWLPPSVRAVVPGGARRHESVAAGIAALGPDAADDDLVLVHDGARPLVSPELVARAIDAAARHGAAIPVVPVAETLKRIDDDRVTGTVDRDGLGAAQTPQAFRVGLLRAAFERFPPAGAETWTDEAALMEACTIPVHAFPGDPANLKVTVPGDLERVAATLEVEGRAPAGPPLPIIGVGQDLHPFGPGTPLVLGGVVVDGAPRLAGHSDGDVVLHAVADALLGAAGLGDLGRLFPAGPQTPAGVDSARLLADVVERVAGIGLAVAGLDITVTGARPRLADRLPTMASRVAQLVGAPASRVSVKASTGNLAGYEGAGRGISALAVARLERAGASATR